MYAGLLESEKTEVADRLGAVIYGGECQPDASTAFVKPIRKIDL
jgi:RPA family protein